MKDLFAKCGVNCAHCPWSRSIRETMKTDEEYQQFKDKCKQVIGFRPTESYQNCLGCHTPDEEIPKESRIPLRNCLIRRCVDKLGVKNCAYCSRFPCGYIKDSQIWTREKFEAKHGAPIPEEDYLTFIEPFEGLKHLETIRATLKPEEIVEVVKVPPLKTRIIEFPKDISLSEEETTTFKVLHQLLATIKRSPLGLEDTDTFAQQQRLKKRRKGFFRFLWIFGCFGEIKEEKLKVDSKTYMANRKEDGLAIWEFVDTVFKVLQQFGVHVEHVPLTKEKYGKKGWMILSGYMRNKGWFMKMSFDDNAGGGLTLKAFKRYAEKLDEKYGKNAFRYFSNVDMRVLKQEK